MKVLIEFPGSHHYFYEYRRVENMYCPECGAKGIFEDQSEGDYYLGSDYICIKCNASFTYQEGEHDESIARQIRTGICDTPTTKKGS